MEQDLTEPGTLAEQGVDHTLQEKVLVYWYWSGRDASEPDLGAGTYRSYLFGSFIAFIISVLGAVVFNVLLDMEIVALVIAITGTLFTLAIIWKGASYSGWYEVDKQGRPVRLYSNIPPEILMGRLGVRRATFLAQVTEER